LKPNGKRDVFVRNIQKTSLFCGIERLRMIIF